MKLSAKGAPGEVKDHVRSAGKPNRAVHDFDEMIALKRTAGCQATLGLSERFDGNTSGKNLRLRGQVASELGAIGPSLTCRTAAD
jgi:hypothetical protein